MCEYEEYVCVCCYVKECLCGCMYEYGRVQ